MLVLTLRIILPSRLLTLAFGIFLEQHISLAVLVLQMMIIRQPERSTPVTEKLLRPIQPGKRVPLRLMRLQ